MTPPLCPLCGHVHWEGFTDICGEDCSICVGTVPLEDETIAAYVSSDVLDLAGLMEDLEPRPRLKRHVFHDPIACAGHHCSLHNPSDHKMKSWPLNWRADRYLMERVCEHGVGHPDPDHVAYSRRQMGTAFASVEGAHGCDGCCHD